MKHELGLLENAIDSLREALKKYEEGSTTNISAYKFSILHFSHFFELLFKYYVTQAHPLLIYKNPFSKNIEKENTIGLWEAVQFLKNEGKEIDKDFNNDLEWIKQLRNQIEHYKFEIDVVGVRRTLGRLIRATNEFNDEHNLLDISKLLGQTHLEIFKELDDEYKSNLATAKFEAKNKTQDSTRYCTLCDELDTAVIIGDKLHCCFCEGQEDIVACCLCGAKYRESDMYVWNDDHPPIIDYVCDYCHADSLAKGK